jgi:hypothetical protein
LVKLRNPLEWIQMPWIRPEDVDLYAKLGITTFKLADRLSDTRTLEMIIESYLTERSPSNLFLIIERNGAKFKRGLGIGNETDFRVSSDAIPADFIEHFASGVCSGAACSYCLSIAEKAVSWFGSGRMLELPNQERFGLPLELRRRAGVEV